MADQWWKHYRAHVCRLDQPLPESNIFVDGDGLVVVEMNAATAEWVSGELGRDGMARELWNAAQVARTKRQIINGLDEDDDETTGNHPTQRDDEPAAGGRPDPARQENGQGGTGQGQDVAVHVTNA